MFSARSIAVYVCTVTQYISLWADCQQVGNDSSQHFKRGERRGEENGEGEAHTYTHMHAVCLDVGCFDALRAFAVLM